MEKNKFYNIIFIIIISVIVLYFSVINIGVMFHIFEKYEITYDNFKTTANNIETDLKTSFKDREKFIELYGLSLLTIRKNIIGNFDFVKDDNGLIQQFVEQINTSQFEKSMKDLNQYLKNKDIPLIFMNYPNKVADFSLAEECNFHGEYNEKLINQLQNFEIDILNTEEFLNKKISKNDFYFKTDGHLTTYAEFCLTNLLLNYLENNYSLNFLNKKFVMDITQYNIHSYDFLGNAARSVGPFFTGIDKFEMYEPKFETNLTLIDKDNNVLRKGNYYEVATNGYQKRADSNMYTYWITNYGQYPQPYYRYENNLSSNAPKLLVIADSMFMRGISFLSLNCSSVTVVDTRYMGNINYVEYALNEQDYDAVIVSGLSSYFLQQGFSVKTQIPQLPELPSQTTDYWIGRNGMWIDNYNQTNIKDADPINIDLQKGSINLVGWAADFINNQPLGDLYLQLDDKIIKCEYNIVRTSVSSYFKNESLTNTGFSVTFPTSYLNGGAVKELRFIQISSDGAYRYAPIIYTLQYS